jgi:hypothetical protein
VKVTTCGTSENTMFPLVTDVRLVMPAVAVAVNVIVSPLE